MHHRMKGGGMHIFQGDPIATTYSLPYHLPVLQPGWEGCPIPEKNDSAYPCHRRR